MRTGVAYVPVRGRPASVMKRSTHTCMLTHVRGARQAYFSRETTSHNMLDRDSVDIENFHGLIDHVPQLTHTHLAAMEVGAGLALDVFPAPLARLIPL